MAMNVIWALTAGMLFAIVLPAASTWVLLNPMVTPMLATKNWQTSMPKAPQLMRGECSVRLLQKISTRNIHEKWATAHSLNSPERDGSGEHVDEGEDERYEEGVGDGACGLEERGGEVEDEVDTCPLLHHLEGSTENRTAEVAARQPRDYRRSRASSWRSNQ
jgi:hypothetical protein